MRQRVERPKPHDPAIDDHHFFVNILPKVDSCPELLKRRKCCTPLVDRDSAVAGWRSGYAPHFYTRRYFEAQCIPYLCRSPGSNESREDHNRFLSRCNVELTCFPEIRLI